MAKQKTIYYLPTSGQLGNQLAIMAHLLAFATAYQYTVVYPGIDYLLKILDEEKLKRSRFHFSKLLANNAVSLPVSKLLRLLFGNKNRPLLNTLIINDAFTVDTAFDRNNQPQTIIITHWLFRFYDGIKQHQDTVRRDLYFKDGVYNNALQIIEKTKLSLPNYTWIGVHIRRGDYATWLDGKYFYDNATYYARMKDIAAETGNCRIHNLLQRRTEV